MHARAPEPRLDLVGDHEHAVLGAELAGSAEVPIGRENDARLALDGLHQEPDDLGVRERGRQCLGVTVGHLDEPGGERPEPATRRWIGGEARRW